MKDWKVLVVTLATMFLANCSQEESTLQASVSPSRTYVISATAKSCITKKTEDKASPSPNDVAASFFQLQYLTVSWPEVTKTLIVASIRLKFQGTQFSGGKYSCEFAGDNLLALNSTWWDKGEAAVGGPEIPSYSNPNDALLRYTPATSVTIDCPIVCGGIDASKAFQASGTVEIIGFSRNPTNGELLPERTTGFLTIESLGN